MKNLIKTTLLATAIVSSMNVGFAKKTFYEVVAVVKPEKPDPTIVKEACEIDYRFFYTRNTDECNKKIVSMFAYDMDNDGLKDYFLGVTRGDGKPDALVYDYQFFDKKNRSIFPQNYTYYNYQDLDCSTTYKNCFEYVKKARRFAKVTKYEVCEKKRTCFNIKFNEESKNIYIIKVTLEEQKKYIPKKWIYDLVINQMGECKKVKGGLSCSE